MIVLCVCATNVVVYVIHLPIDISSVTRLHYLASVGCYCWCFCTNDKRIALYSLCRCSSVLFLCIPSIASLLFLFPSLLCSYCPFITRHSHPGRLIRRNPLHLLSFGEIFDALCDDFDTFRHQLSMADAAIPDTTKMKPSIWMICGFFEPNFRT